MSDAPDRPATVPPEAWWEQDDEEWVLGPLDEEGEKHGSFRYWRKDGTLCNTCEYVHGTPHGPFKRYHENGEVSQDGRFVDGKIHGTRTWYACDALTTERMHEGGISKAVRRTEMDYAMGRVTGVRHFEAAGNRINPDGTPYPTQPPAGVPKEAEYRADKKLWMLGRLDDDNERTGLWQTFSSEGVLIEAAEFKAGEKHGTSKLCHPDGKPKEEGRYQEGKRVGRWRFWGDSGRLIREVELQDDRPHGVMKVWFEGDGNLILEATFEQGVENGAYLGRLDPGYYADPRLHFEKGLMRHGVRVETWQLCDQQREPLRTVDYGVPRGDDELAASPVLADQGRPAAQWSELARRLRGERRIGEAVLAAARAAAQDSKPDPLRALLTELAAPLSPDAALRETGQLLKDDRKSESLAALAGGLVAGASAPGLLRAIAIVLDQRNLSRAALDFINAALLFEPERADCYFTRALIHMSLGQAAEASADAERVERAQPAQGRFLRNYCKVLFPLWGFWPAREPPETYYDGLPERPAQELAAIRTAVQKYATRLMRVREALLAKAPADAPWMLPDLKALLPARPVELRKWTITVADQDDPDESQEIEIDETLEANELGIPDALRAARADWNALCWLCWAVGLDRVALPEAVEPPANYGQAAGMAAQRLWRARDKVHMRGYGAQRQGVPGFAWEGIDIDEMPGSLARMPEAEYAEMQALFYWLSDADNQSPWQDNLRGS